MPRRSCFYLTQTSRSISSGGEALGLSTHYQGHDGVRAWIRDWRSQWGDYDEVIEQLIDLGDSVVTRTKITTRGERSGVELTRTAGNHFHLDDGKSHPLGRVLRL